MLNVWHTQPRAYPLHTTWNHRVRIYQKINIIYIHIQNTYRTYIYIYTNTIHTENIYTAKTSLLELPIIFSNLESFLIILGPILASSSTMSPPRSLKELPSQCLRKEALREDSVQRKDGIRWIPDVGSESIPFWDVKKKTAGKVDVDLSFFWNILPFFLWKKRISYLHLPYLVMLKAGCLYGFLHVEIPTIRIG